MKNLIRAAWQEPVVADDFERRAMMAIARAESERLRRRARWTAIAAAACLVGLLLSLPVDDLIDGFGTAATEIFSGSR